MKPYRILALVLAALLLCGCGAATEQTAPETVPADTAVSAEPAVDTDVPEGSSEEVSDAPAITLPDGVYSAEFITDSSMFHANEACDGKGVLTVENGTAVFHVSLVSKSILKLYLGMAADAETDEAAWLQPTEDTVTYSDGLSDVVYGFDIPVTVIGEDFDLALIGKKGVWYDHKVSVANPVPMVQDGIYTCEVSLVGGSGRATVESPAMITAADGVLTATIRWRSPNYDFMMVGDVRYEPVQTEGNSTFEIPVVLDADLAVSADTIAMSEPHLIDYTLHFDGSTLTEAAE